MSKHFSSTFTRKLSLQHKILFGQSFFDNIIGHIPHSTLILLEEDLHSYNHLTFIQTFIAQNATQDLTVYSMDLKEIYIPVRNFNSTNHKNIESMKIAWRYENLQQRVDDTKYDYRNKIIYNTNIQLDNPNMLLQKLKCVNNNSIVVVVNMFSPIWNVPNIELYLYEIKKIVKMKKLVFLACVPTFLYTFQKIHFCVYFDIVLMFKSLVMDNSLHNYTGLMEMKKNCKKMEMNEDTVLYGIRTSRYGLQVENIEIPPESGEVSGCNVQDMF